MDRLGDVIRKNPRKANLRLHSEAHVLADEMVAYFREPKRFAMYLGVIKRLGVSKARAIFSQVKSSDSGAVQNPRKLFMWLARDPD